MSLADRPLFHSDNVAELILMPDHVKRVKGRNSFAALIFALSLCLIKC